MSDKIKGYSSWLNQHKKIKAFLWLAVVALLGGLYGIAVVSFVTIAGYYAGIWIIFIFTGQYWSALGIVSAVAAFLGAIASVKAFMDNE